MVVGVVAGLAAVAALGLLLAVGAPSGGPDYGIPGLLLTLSAVCAAVATTHLAFALVTRSAWRDGKGGGRSVLVVAALAGPALVVAALLSGLVSVDWPVLLLGLAATFGPHAVSLLRGDRRGRRGPTASATARSAPG